MRKMVLCLVCVLGFGLALTSCDNNTPSITLEGIWETAPPVQMGFTATHILEFDAAGTFVYSMRATFTGITTAVTSGTYSISGNTITFVLEQDTVIGTISNDTLTITWGAHTFTKVEQP